MLQVFVGWIFQQNVSKEHRVNHVTRKNHSGPDQNENKKPSCCFLKFFPPFDPHSPDFSLTSLSIFSISMAGILLYLTRVP